MTNTYFTPEVFLISSDGKMLGKMPTGKARSIAKDEGMDLIEIGKQQGLSLCKVGDSGKWAYDQKKKQKSQQHHYHLKEMKFGVQIQDHDFQTKIRQIEKFLDKGYDVKITVELHGREKSHPEIAGQKMDEVIKQFEGKIKTEPVKKFGSNFSVVMHPSKVKINEQKDARIDE